MSDSSNSIQGGTNNGSSNESTDESNSINNEQSLNGKNLFFNKLNIDSGFHHIINLISFILSENNFRIEIQDCESNSDISKIKDYIEIKLKHEKSSMNFRIKILLVTKNKISVSAYAEEDDDKVFTWNFKVDEYLSSSDKWKLSFENKDWDSMFKNKLNDFSYTFRREIIRMLIPMGKEDITEDKGTQSFEEIYEIPPQRRGWIGGIRDFDPLRDERVSDERRYFPPGGNVGSSDLYPSGFGPLNILPNNGMFVGPNSSYFQPRGNLPINPPGVPPGARYDPFGQEPDPDHFPLPGPPRRAEPRSQGRGGLGGPFGGNFGGFPF